MPCSGKVVSLVPRMPKELAVDIDLFSRGGSAILDRIEARGFDVLSARPALTRWTKLRLLGRAVAAMGMAQLKRSQVKDIRKRSFVNCANGFSAKVVENERHAMKMDRALRVKLRVLRTLARREARNFYCAFLLLPAAAATVDVCALRVLAAHRRSRGRAGAGDRQSTGTRRAGGSNSMRRWPDWARPGLGFPLSPIRSPDMRSQPICS